MKANAKGAVLIKCDRINERIDKFYEYFLNLEKIKSKDTITKEDLKEFVASMHVIVTTELNEKGAERIWKK